MINRNLTLYVFLAAFVGLCVVTLLAVAKRLPMEPHHLDRLVSVLLVGIALAAIKLFRTTDFFGDDGVRRVVTAIEGDWWQITKGDGTNVIVLLALARGESARSVRMSGRAYSVDGEEIATFRETVATASANYTVHYFWKGDEKAEHSGVGELSFTAPTGRAQVRRGTGWYTTGNLGAEPPATVTHRVTVNYLRATSAEAQAMRDARGPAEVKVMVDEAIKNLTSARK